MEEKDKLNLADYMSGSINRYQLLIVGWRETNKNPCCLCMS